MESNFTVKFRLQVMNKKEIVFQGHCYIVAVRYPKIQAYPLSESSSYW